MSLVHADIKTTPGHNELNNIVTVSSHATIPQNTDWNSINVYKYNSKKMIILIKS